MRQRGPQAGDSLVVSVVLLTIIAILPLCQAEWIAAGNYGTWTEANVGQFSYSSELDHRHAVKKEREAQEKHEREEREYQEHREAEERRRENRPVYVPKPQQKPAITTSYNNARGVTADRFVSSMAVQRAVSPPPSLPVPTQREGYELIGLGDEFYHYKDGAFFIDMDGDFMRVPAPAGAMVSKIPEDTEVREVDGVRYFVVEHTWYQRVMVSGYAVFKVVPSQE